MFKTKQTLVSLLPVLLLIGLLVVNVGDASPRSDPPGACRQNDTTFNTLDGGCKDLASGLVWSASSYEQTGYYHTYSGAQSYCSNLAEGGYSDWRTPTKDELVAVSAHGGGAHLGPGNLYIAYDWSSTTKGNKAYAVEVGPGAVTLSLEGSGFDTICVR